MAVSMDFLETNFACMFQEPLKAKSLMHNPRRSAEDIPDSFAALSPPLLGEMNATPHPQLRILSINSI